MKRKIIIATLLAMVSFSAIAQNSGKNFRPNITIGYSRNYMDMGNAFQIYEDEIYSEFLSCGSMFVSADLLSFNKYLSGGLYIGGQLASQKCYDDNGHEFFTLYFAGRMGISAHLHLLQCLNVETNAWDLSLNTSLGSFWCPKITPQTEYGLGLSAIYYPLKHVGLSIGCDWGKNLVSRFDGMYVQKGCFSLKAGLNIRFGNSSSK